jgi:hypothetical protein
LGAFGKNIYLVFPVKQQSTEARRNSVLVGICRRASTFWYRLRQMTAFSHLKLEVRALQLSATVFWWVFAEGALQKGAETDL